MDNNSVIVSNNDTVSNIDDEILQDALNISDNESLHNNIILEEGYKVPLTQINIENVLKITNS